MELRSILATDCGSTTTKAILIEKIDGDSDNGLGRFAGKRKVSIEDFEDLIEFDNEPFERRRTSGLHRVELKP